MESTSDAKDYSKYVSRDHSGYLLAPWISGVPHELVAIRHSASVPPWADRDIHLHRDAEEYYIVLQGELQLLVDGSILTLQPHELLMVRPQVPHAMVAGRGPIEHFVLRFPGVDDRQTVGEIPDRLSPVVGEAERELESDWGCRVPLAEARYQNCWLFGVGRARFPSQYMCMAYLRFPDDDSVGADKHPHRLHLHERSWEYYAVLTGARVLRVGGESVEIGAGEILEVPPRVKHVLHATRTPFEGFTFRVPRLDDKVTF